jgi:UDP-N-acetylglucosamine/UDP-N-acetylgalactosamine diphosphorylase
MPPLRKNESSLSPVDLLLQKGVVIPVPSSVEIGTEVDVERISGEGVVIHAGCRIFGRETLISPRVVLGREGPVSVEDCQIGEGAALKGGSFRKATLLAGVSAGTCAEVREGSLFEEGVRLAHAVGTKQTVLFPFATLGSLVNFCDCLLSGGTSAKNHSEVGSSYIHFNYTPQQDKATPSLLGDVPRGVMLREPPIFLGGQGGLVGPARIGYGVVISAGAVFRGDCPEGGKMLFGAAPRAGELPFTPGVYREVRRKFLNNVIYLANLFALRQWYREVRSGFFTGEAETLLYKGARARLEEAFAERIKRLGEFVEKLAASPLDGTGASYLLLAQKKELSEKWPAVAQSLSAARDSQGDRSLRDAFLARMKKEKGRDYLGAIRGLSPEAVDEGTRWLQGIVDGITRGALDKVPILEKNSNQ